MVSWNYAYIPFKQYYNISDEMAAAIKPGLGSIPSSEQKCPPNFTCSATENNLLRICKKNLLSVKRSVIKK